MAAAGTADYVDLTLGAFAFDPPRIWAGRSVLRVASAARRRFDQFIPLSRVEELAWRTRIEGSRGIAEREWNGPVRGWQEVYREGIEMLGSDFLELAGEEQDAALGSRAGAEATAVRACVRSVLRSARVRRQP